MNVLSATIHGGDERTANHQELFALNDILQAKFSAK
jgi:hypothetical protein